MVAERKSRARLHVVTGKGGSGKTTVATALAMAMARGGRRTLLIEAEGRQSVAQLFGLKPFPYEELPIAQLPGGGEVLILAIDAEAALLEYLDVFYHLGMAGRALHKVGAIDFATTIAPGVRDVLLTGKIKESATRTTDGRPVYDTVVLDAPPTGRIGKFLNITSEAAKLAKVGPIKTHSEGVAVYFRSPATTVHMVTLLEDMPVQESVDALDELGQLALPLGTLIVNRARDPILNETRITQAEVRRGLVHAGLPADKEVVVGLVSEARDHQTRLAAEARLRERLESLGRPLVELPTVPHGATGVTRHGLDILAKRLSTSLAHLRVD